MDFPGYFDCYNYLVSTFIRKVTTKSQATAVQIVRKEGGRIVNLKHIGSANNPEKLTLLLEIARKQLLGGQLPLFIRRQEKRPVLALGAASALLFQALQGAYQSLEFDQLNDATFEQLVLARLIEPASKLDTIRILQELGLKPPSYTGIYRCLKRVITQGYRLQLAACCLKAAGQKHLSLLLYDVTTLYFEIQKEDGFRKPGLSKERRLEPQIVVGLLVDRSGFPLQIQEFKGNMAETKTIMPVLKAFRQEHRLSGITVVADAAMMRLKNLKALAKAVYTYVVGSLLNKIPYAIADYRKTKELSDGQIVTEERKTCRIIYQYREKRAVLDRQNIAKQTEKAQRIVSGKVPAHRAKFVTVTGQVKSLNQKLIAKAEALAGIKGYVTNLKDLPDVEIINHYHRLFQVEKSFRMSKSDLKARPIFHHKLDSIKAHLTIVFAALAISRQIEARTKLSIKRFVQALRPIHTPTLLINGIKTNIDPFIPEEVQQIVDNLSKN